MTADGHNSRVQSQFGASAEQYRTSATHARGRSLSRLVELVDPQSGWQMLDVATGAGHTAAFLAPRVERVVAGDLTPEMLQQAGIVVRDRGLSNVLFVQESAQSLSYRDDVFDLVTCRVAAHHFPDPAAFVAECARVLKPAGVLAVIDNIVPANGDDADWINDFERRRDPSHAHCLALSRWRDLYARNGLVILHDRVDAKWFDFEDWMRRMNVDDAAIDRLGDELLHAPAGVRAFWQPRREQQRIKLALQEAILIGRAR